MSRKGLYRTLSIPTPQGLMNTSLSSQNLPLRYSPRVENMVVPKGKARSLAKRFGGQTYGDAIGWGTVKHLAYYVNSSGQTEIFAYCDDSSTARIYRSTDSGATWSSVKSGLTTGGICFTEVFTGNLIFVNGLDNNMYWDGSAIQEMGEYVEEQFSSGSQTDTDTITFTPFKGADHDFVAGQSIKVTFATAGEVTATIDTVSYSAPTLTVNITTTAFPSPNETITKIEYFDRPPPFGFIKTAHDRLWALTGGVWKATEYRSQTTNSFVYFTDVSNAINAWFDATTQEVSYINTRDKAGVFDELIAISHKDGLTVFHGRNTMQVWGGVDPSEFGDFSWVKNIPVGTLHPKGVQAIGNNVAFYTKYGLRTLQNVFALANVEVGADVGAEVDPTVQDQIDAALESDAAYRSVTAFGYDRDGLYGFRAGEDMLVYSVGEEVKGWVVFSGIFTNAESFVELPNGLLLMSTEDDLYYYANGADGSDLAYDDNGASFKTIWQTQWIENNKRWANNHIELVIQPGAPEQTLTIQRFRDNNTNDVYEYELTVDSSFPEWDVADWDTAYWTAEDVRYIQRDKYIADSMSYKIQSETTTGPLELVRLNLGGR